MKRAWTVLALLAVLPLAAQPVFTEEDLPEIGYQAEFLSDTSEVIVVEVGTTGGPQTWDYSRAINGLAETFEVEDPDSTDWESSFPTAQYVYHLAGVLSDTLSGEMWQYMEATPTEFKLLGAVMVSDTFEVFADYNPDRTQSVFPLQMDATWNDFFHIQDSIDQAGTILFDQIGKSSSEVDAWGTVIVPADSFDALRIITYDTTITTILFFGVPMGADTSVTIGYSWVAKDVGPVMYITSRNWEQNPEFDTAGSYLALFQNNLEPPAVEEKVATRPLFVVRGNEVLLHLEAGLAIDVSIYDASGRKVEGLYNGISGAGELRLMLPRDLSRGVYFIRLQTPTCTACEKMISIK